MSIHEADPLPFRSDSASASGLIFGQIVVCLQGLDAIYQLDLTWKENRSLDRSKTWAGWEDLGREERGPDTTQAELAVLTPNQLGVSGVGVFFFCTSSHPELGVV